MPTFDELKDGYTDLWRACSLRASRKASAEAMAAKVLRGRAHYEKVEGATGVPWWWIGIAHARESACSFATHLHNGDSLKARTWRVPKGRPAKGSGPFTWDESALDALQIKGLHKIKDWSIERACFEWERYNGFGYRKPGRSNSPYLWAGTNAYSTGKYVADHKYDPRHEDKQSGCLAILKCMLVKEPGMLTPAPLSTDAVQSPPALEPTSKEAHESAHEDLKQTSLWYRIKRWFLKALGIGGAGSGLGLAQMAKDDPIGTIEQVGSIVLKFGIFISLATVIIIAVVEIMQWRERNRIIGEANG